MLEQVRRRMKSGATYVLVAGLTVIFMFFFGVPTQDCASGGPAGRNTNAVLASIDGEEIESKDVNLIYNRIFDDSNSEQKQYRQRRAASLRNVLLIKLFAKRAREAGLRVSQTELTDYIEDPARNVEVRFTYGREGTFNGHYYKAYVENRLRASLDEYEKFKRDELLARNYLAMQAAQLAVPSAELQSTHAIQNTEMNLAFVELSADKLKSSVRVSDADVSTFLEDSADQVKNYYEQNKQQEFSQPAELKVRRVYIPRPSDSADGASAENRWNEAQKRIFETGEPVGQVAADLGESIPGQEKGMMGWSTVDNMDQNIVDALKGEDVGTKKRVETDGAYMIVKLEDRREAETESLEEVRTEIAKQLLREKRVDSLVQEVTTELREKAAETGSLQEALAALKEASDKPVWDDLSVEETGSFTLDQKRRGMGSWSNIPKIGDSQKLAVDAYKQLSESNPVPDKVYEVGSSKYIVRLKSKTSPDDQSSPSSALVHELSVKKVNDIIGRWSGVVGTWQSFPTQVRRMMQARNLPFPPPMKEYGPWIDRQLSDAVDNGTITLYPNNSPVVRMVEESFQPGGDGAGGGPKAGKGKGGPIQIGGQKGKSKQTIKIGGGEGEGGGNQISPEQLKQLKKKLKMQQKLKQKAGGDPPGGSPGGSDSSGSQGGSESQGGSGSEGSSESGGGE